MFFFLYSFPIYVPTIFKSGYIDISMILKKSISFNIILVILTYFLIIIGGAAGIGLIVVFLRKLGKIESKDKLEEEKLDD